jgi:hypothetical protein
MQNLHDPEQTLLFDPWALVFSGRLYARVRSGWQGLFHDVLLRLMPAEELAEHFHPELGRPTKELYSVAGLIFLKEFHDWTEEDAVEAYCFRLDVQYALNVARGDGELSLRTLERYLKLFRELGLARMVFDEVTQALVDHLELDVSRQRLDSTHVYSNMAMFGRTSLMVKAVQRFLTQVLRHHRERYEALPEELRARYAPNSPSSPFGWARAKNNADQRRRLRQQVADDMYLVLTFYDGEEAITNKDTYKQLLRVFEEHCEVIEDAVTVRPKSDPRALQSLSDLDATYDGHKGRGYQAQVCQTCSEQNEVQLITGLLPQTAADSDSTALPEMIEHLEDRQRKPEQLLADTAYGSDDNVEHCAAKGVELVAPVKARHEGNEDALSALDFEIDETTREVQRCPAGNTPCTTGYSEKRDEGYALFERATCEACPNFGRCLVYKHKKHYRLKYSKKTLRLETRRRDQDSPAFKERYRKRAGVEGLISALKRGRGFGRLRVRGQPAVRMALYLKATGHNLFQAARCVRKQRKDPSNGPQPKQNIHSGQLSVRFGFVAVLQRLSQTIASVLLPLQRHKPPYLTLHLASTKTFLAG